MTKIQGNTETGVSDLIGTVLIIILVIGLAAVIVAFLMPGLLQKSVYIASEVRPIPIQQLSGIPVDVIGILPIAGDPFYIIWQPTAYKSGTPVSVRALGPDGVNHTWSSINLAAGNLYGRQIYIYPPVDNPDPSKCDLCISDQPPDPTKNLIPMEKGRWTIQFVDENAHILVMSNSDGVIKGGSTSRPNAGGMLGDLYDNNCQLIMSKISNLGQALKDPAMNNMLYQNFNGAQNTSYKSIDAFNISGDLSLSLWIRPQGLVNDTNDYAHWETIIGKGNVDPGSPENDNYQLIAVGKKLIFEWDDKNQPPRHFQLSTDQPILQNGLWTYTTLTIENGIPQIYINGIKQSSTIREGNDPRSTVIPATLPVPPVRLKLNDYRLNIGKQNSTTWPFYYQGDIGSMGIYDRALSLAEIQQNNESKNA